MEFGEATAPSEPTQRLAIMGETNSNQGHVAEVQKQALTSINSSHLLKP